jgi:methionyl-tRNA formyltransferase
VHVGTGTRALELGEVQAQGKKPMAAADWARGLAFDAEPRLGARLIEPE